MISSILFSHGGAGGGGPAGRPRGRAENKTVLCGPKRPHGTAVTAHLSLPHAGSKGGYGGAVRFSET